MDLVLWISSKCGQEEGGGPETPKKCGRHNFHGPLAYSRSKCFRTRSIFGVNWTRVVFACWRSCRIWSKAFTALQALFVAGCICFSNFTGTRKRTKFTNVEAENHPESRKSRETCQTNFDPSDYASLQRATYESSI